MPDIGQLENLRAFFTTGVTLSYRFRRDQLLKLKALLTKYEDEIFTALYNDLKKSREESWATEIGLVMAELNTAIKHMKGWMRPERKSTNLLNLPSSSKVISEPLGVVLIIGPWNYPFQLLINPLVGAIAAGNCIVLKPSEHAPAIESVMRKMIEEVFPQEYILYVRGEGSEVIPKMMEQFRFDHVFYTGSTTVGRIIYKLAAEKLVPVTLELGGKSPCVVESDANIKVAGRRIALTKFTNAGQMCVAPDYILVHESVKDKLIDSIKEAATKFFTVNPAESYNYGKIINEKQFNRIVPYISEGKLVFGGHSDKEKLFIEPTIITDISPDSKVMKDEIFGPVLPIISFSEMKEATEIISQSPNPLAFYIFSSDKKKQEKWLEAIPSGGSCINNCSWHLTNHNLPFGGRGLSGTGAYHGKYTFDTFSHKKAVMSTPTWFDPSIKYPPFKGKLKLFKRMIR